MKLGGNLPPGHDALLFSITSAGSLIMSGRTYPAGHIYTYQDPTRGTEHLGFPPVLRDWVINGPDMSGRVYATGHIKDSVHLSKREGDCLPVVGFLLGSSVIIITGLNKLYNCMFSP